MLKMQDISGTVIDERVGRGGAGGGGKEDSEKLPACLFEKKENLS